MSITCKINQKDCIGCASCVEVSEGEIAINDDGVAYFVHSEPGHQDVGNLGTEIGLAVIDYCPEQCIEQIG